MRRTDSVDIAVEEAVGPDRTGSELPNLKVLVKGAAVQWQPALQLGVSDTAESCIGGRCSLPSETLLM